MTPSSITPSPTATDAAPQWVGVRAAQIPEAEMAALLQGQHGNPFAVLGLHQTPLSDWVFRTVIPAQTGAVKAKLLNLQGLPLTDLVCVDAAGFFIGVLPKDPQGQAPAINGLQPLIIEATTGNGHVWRYVDAYTFGPVLGPMDDHLMAAGDHLMLSHKLGANVMLHEGVSGVHFAVWAPNARRVSVVGAFNDWDGRRHIMRKRSSGVWEAFVPDLPVGSVYKYEIMAANCEVLPLKADPMGQAAQLRPDNASVVANTQGWDDTVWQDADYLRARSQRDARAQPMSIYEVHLGSWQRADDGSFLSYDELAARLIPYVKDMGYTHIEVLPITEHPLDASWGYQPTGLFAPTARFGAPDGFARLVNAAHAAHIGVILDWVPAHFPTDAHGLAQFDGTALYEHADKRQGFHPDWNTAIFNFGRTEVCAYLLNNALHWLDKYHLDGLRVDAVASMLYLDYSRKDGEWIPNEHGGRENLEAIAFLQRVNSAVYAQHPGVMTIAEESTAFPGVSHPVYSGGLGFGFKWNMGFMHDTLDYFKLDPVHRQHHHNRLTFGLLYAFTENFVLPLSHDEVVHGKGTLLTKMSGDNWQQFANLRALYGFMWGYPGKKLLFMGQEFGQRAEWNENKALDWHLLDHAPHRGVQQLVRDLNHAYQTIPALHQADCDGSGFAWAVVDDHTQSVLAWTRHAEGAPPVLVVANLTPVVRTDYRVPVPAAGRWREVINTDAAVYGGSNVGNMGQLQTQIRPEGGAALHLTLPPLSTLVLLQEEA